jgi:phage shock protein A
MPAAGHHVLKKQKDVDDKFKALRDLEEELRRKCESALVMGNDQLAAAWKEAADGIKEVLNGTDKRRASEGSAGPVG